jgi:hypothetical protein
MQYPLEVIHQILLNTIVLTFPTCEAGAKRGKEKGFIFVDRGN